MIVRVGAVGICLKPYSLNERSLVKKDVMSQSNSRAGRKQIPLMFICFKDHFDYVDLL